MCEVVSQAEWLIEHRHAMDRGEAEWLVQLAIFDRDQGWAADGQLSCVDWLVWRARMARATAYEKLLVARQLLRRPIVADAFSEGRVSYSAVRAICRIEDPDAEVDQALIDVAEAGSVVDVERAVRCYQLHADQHRPPSDPTSKRGLRIRRGVDGTSTVEVVLTDVEVEEVAAALRMAIDRAGDSARAESAFPSLRADALMDLIRSGLSDHPAAAADRYMVHVIQEIGSTPVLVDGAPLDPAEAETVFCDCSLVEHTTSGGEPLRLGRLRRTWNTAQRRAILVRDRSTCRFPGCQRRVADIHHLLWWDRGGNTDVDNGLLICPRHHTMLHRGYDAGGDTNHPVWFRRPDGSLLGYN